MALLKGSTLQLKSQGGTVRIEWQQWFQTKHQSYAVCEYTLNDNPIPVYIQEGYDIPRRLTVDSRLQYGSQSGIVFFVYHDKGQKPYQRRFRSTMFEDIAKMGGKWLKDRYGGQFDPSAYVGEYLHDV